MLRLADASATRIPEVLSEKISSELPTTVKVPSSIQAALSIAPCALVLPEVYVCDAELQALAHFRMKP